MRSMPAANSLLQSGTASNPSLFQFNGAISPNRQVNGATKTGGDAMVLNYDSSSSAAFPADQDGLQGRSRRAVRSGRGQELAGAAVRVRLQFGDPVLPLGRLRRRDPRPVNCEPDLAGQPVRRRLGKRHHRPGNLEDPELRRHSVGLVQGRGSEGVVLFARARTDRSGEAGSSFFRPQIDHVVADERASTSLPVRAVTVAPSRSR